jgi:hypothetical protein
MVRKRLGLKANLRLHPTIISITPFTSTPLLDALQMCEYACNLENAAYLYIPFDL